MVRPERYERVLTISERVYKALLTVCPKEFRDEYGSQMVLGFRDLCREELERRGVAGFARLWGRTALDLATTALVERSSSRVNDEELVRTERRQAGIGFVLLLAPLYFISASLLKYGLGVGLLFDPLEAFLSISERREIFNLVSPDVFLGGLGLAMALNAYAVLRPSVVREEDAVVCTVRIRMKFWNTAVVAASSMLLFTLVGYVFLENFVARF
ncbi:MAG TPA: hypothetical protein VNA27_02075 [Rubrobacteraceae bacterium]|nr:hypothetical protein [Rubrobacteraceae bacterium]